MSVTGFVALSLYVAILVTKLVLARRYLATDNGGEPGFGDVTVMQPILGGDPALGETLRRNLEQVDARFLWLVDDDDAEGQRVTGEIAASNARVAILRCPPVSANENPKTVKLQRGLETVETTYVAVLDDDTILPPGHLDRAVVALESCTLYTGLPCYLPGTSFWSSLVTHFVNNNSALTYLPLLPLIGPLTINGMFYVMRTGELRAMGGFAPITRQLCDDYALAKLVRTHGGTIHQGSTRQYLRTTVPSMGQYIRLMHRWFLFANELVRDQTVAVQAVLFVALGLPPILLWIGLATLSYALPAALLVRHLIIRSLRDPAGGGTSVPVSILSELLQPLHWLHATLQHSLRWRTRRIALGPDGTFSYIGGPAS